MGPCDSLAWHSYVGVLQCGLNGASMRRTHVPSPSGMLHSRTQKAWIWRRLVFPEKVAPTPLVQTLVPTPSLKNDGLVALLSHRGPPTDATWNLIPMSLFWCRAVHAEGEQVWSLHLMGSTQSHSHRSRQDPSGWISVFFINSWMDCCQRPTRVAYPWEPILLCVINCRQNLQLLI